MTKQTLSIFTTTVILAITFTANVEASVTCDMNDGDGDCVDRLVCDSNAQSCTFTCTDAYPCDSDYHWDPSTVTCKTGYDCEVRRILKGEGIEAICKKYKILPKEKPALDK